MPDWPVAMDQIVPMFINTYTMLGSNGSTRGGLLNLGAPASATYPTANLAIYLPFYLPFSYNVKQMYWANGTAAGGNTDIGIYSPSGQVIWHSGSVACSGNSSAQFVSVSPNAVLSPGNYYWGYAHSAITANQVIGQTAMTAAVGRMCGFYQQALGALPLPNAATFAQWATAYYPFIGMTNQASGF